MPENNTFNQHGKDRQCYRRAPLTERVALSPFGVSTMRTLIAAALLCALLPLAGCHNRADGGRATIRETTTTHRVYAQPDPTWVEVK